jgi:serine protease Do
MKRYILLTVLLSIAVLFTAGCQIGSAVRTLTSATIPTPTRPPAILSPTTTPAPTRVEVPTTAPSTVASPTVAPSSSPALSAAPTPSRPPDSAAVPSVDLRTAVRMVTQRLRPAVVQITSEQTAMDQFDQAFTVPAGVGSGFIYDAQGHILTNNHVVEGADQLQVSLPDGRSFQAKLIGRDPQTDLAVVQIEGDNLPVAELGDPGQLQVGDWVVAIGNALALPGGPTVTAGVVSATGRTVQEPGTRTTVGPFLFGVIQTDASINPGNSGGPLANLAGQVVAINTLVAGQAEPGVQAQGIGFAIAIDTAKPIADQLVATGQVVHPSLGFVYLLLNPSIAIQLGLPGNTQGVVVTRVSASSLAAQAGLRRLDVITAVDGQMLATESILAQIVSAHKPGDLLALTVLRDGNELNVKLTLGQTATP